MSPQTWAHIHVSYTSHKKEIKSKVKTTSITATAELLPSSFTFIGASIYLTVRHILLSNL